jgi:hypothetical protein
LRRETSLAVISKEKSVTSTGVEYVPVIDRSS